VTAQGDPSGDALAESLNPLSAKPAIAWIERQRATVTDVQRYTRFVVIMKRALPMAAVTLLAAVLAYSLQPRLQNSKNMAITFRNLHILNNDLMMTKPRLTGVDGNGKPYVVTAEDAIQDPHNSKRAQLHKVEADMTLKTGEWVNLTATRGQLDEGKQLLWLAGVIDVYSDNGYEVHTTAANIDLVTGNVVGKRYVTGLGPFGTFRADSFVIDRGMPRPANPGVKYHAPKSDGKTDNTKIFLYGNVHMTILKRGATRS
jgi:lipopolysaccharide export system protein LptC